LIGRGSKLDAVDKRGRTAYQLAVSGGHEALANALQDAGAPASISDDEQAERTRKWLKRTAYSSPGSESAKATSGSTDPATAPLIMAARRGNIEVVRMLLNDGAPSAVVDQEGYDALSRASETGHLDVAKALLEAHADPEGSAPGGRTPLLLAAAKGHSRMVSLLLRAKADPNVRDAAGMTPLHHSIRIADGKSIRELTNHGALIGLAPDGAETTECWAARLSPGSLTLLPAIAPTTIDTPCQDGQTLLTQAAAAGEVATLDTLLSFGAKVDQPTKRGSTALMLAAANGHAAAATRLIESGADVNSRGEDRSTALMLAAAGGHTQVVALLLDHGAKTNVRNAGGKTALALAQLGRHDESVRILETHPAARSTLRDLF
jgi:ankyrin repeat protein